MKTKTKIASGRTKPISGVSARPATSSQVNMAGGALRLQLQSILVPTDFSTPSLKALRYAAALAAQFGAKLTLLHVVEPIGPTPDFAYNPLVLDDEVVMANAKEQLQRLLERQGVDVALVERTLVRDGVPFNEISAAASRLKADLIVIATHGYTGLKHVFLGSTAERVVRHAPCPVLVVREDEREFIAK
jgi:universal stress protein A